MLKFFQDKFFIANAADYQGKKAVFYPLKEELLRRHGKPDGYDLQTIRHTCWDCNGKGCNSCCYSGIYNEYEVYLLRYKLGNKVYHIPTRVHQTGNAANFIYGYVKHDYIHPEKGARACIWLMARYKPAKLIDMYISQFLWMKTRSMKGDWINNLSPFKKLLVSIAGIIAGCIPCGWNKDSLCVSYANNYYFEHLTWVMRVSSDVPW